MSGRCEFLLYLFVSIQWRQKLFLRNVAARLYTVTSPKTVVTQAMCSALRKPSGKALVATWAAAAAAAGTTARRASTWFCTWLINQGKSLRSVGCCTIVNPEVTKLCIWVEQCFTDIMRPSQPKACTTMLGVKE